MQRLAASITTLLTAALIALITPFSPIFASATIAYVDYSYSGTPQLDSIDNPYTTVQDALFALSTDQLDGSYKFNNLISEVIIKKDAIAVYSLGGVAGVFFSLTADATLTIKYEDDQATASGLSSCNTSFPILEFNYSTSFLFTGLTNITVQGVVLHFNIIAETLPDQFGLFLGMFLLWFDVVEDLRINNTCITESGFVSNYYVVFFDSVGRLEVENTIFNRVTAQGFKFNALMQTFENITIVVNPESGRFSGDRYLYLNLYAYSPCDIAFKNLTITTNPVDTPLLPGELIYIEQSSSTTLEQITIIDSQLQPSIDTSLKGLFSILTSPIVTVSGLTINNSMIYGAAGTFATVFYLPSQANSNTEIKGTYIINSRLVNATLLNLNSSNTVSITLDNFTLTNVWVNFSTVININRIAQGLTFQASAVTISNTTLGTSKLILFAQTVTSTQVTNYNILTLVNWDVSDSSIASSSLFFSNFPSLTGWEQLRARLYIQNFGMSDNVLTAQTDSYFGAITLNSIFTSLGNITVKNNEFFTGTSAIYSPNYAENIIMRTATVENNLFYEANFISVNMSQNAYLQLPAVPSTSRLLKVLYLLNSVFDTNYLYSSDLIDASSPQIYLINLEFINTIFITYSRLISLGNIHQPPNFPYSQRDTAEETLLFSNEPDVLALFNRPPSFVFARSSMALFEILIVENTFDGVESDQEATLVRVIKYSLTNSQVLLAASDVKNVNLQDNSDQSLFIFDSLNSYIHWGNDFLLVKSNTPLVTLANFKGDQNLTVAFNVMARSRLPIVMECTQSQFSSVNFQLNNYTDLTIQQAVIAFTFTVEQSANFINETMQSITLTPLKSSTTPVAIYFMRTISDSAATSSLVFANHTIDSVAVAISPDIFINFLPKAIFVVSVSNYTVSITQSIITNIDLQTGNLFVISAAELDIVDSQIIGANSSSNFGFTFLNLNKLAVWRCIWSALQGSLVEEGGLFNLQQDSTHPELVVELINSTFREISAYRGAVLDSRLIKLSLNVTGCRFIQNQVVGTSVMNFESTVFTSFRLHNNTVVTGAPNSSNLVDFLMISDCQMADSASPRPTISETILDMMDHVKFTAFIISSSPHLDLLIDQVLLLPNTFNDHALAPIMNTAVLKLDGSLVTLSSFQSINPLVTFADFIQLTCSTGTPSTFLLQSSSISSAVFSDSSSTQSKIFLNIVASSSYFCPHTVTVNASDFQDLVVYWEGSLILDNQNIENFHTRVNTPTVITLIDSNFTNIQGRSGSVVGLWGAKGSSTLIITGCEFANNSASSFGGVVRSQSSEVSITGSTFINNTATVYGNVLWTELGEFNITNYLVNNDVTLQVLDGTSAAAYSTFSRNPNSLNLLFQDASILSESPVLVLDNITSYSFRTLSFTVQLTYFTGSEYILVPDLSANSLVTFTFMLSGYNQSASSPNCDRGVCTINGLGVDVPGKSGTLYSVIVTYSSDYFFQTQTFQIYMRGCIPGEIANADQTQCTFCGAGTYSFDPSDSSCKPCPIGAYCTGGAVMDLTPGYWRPSMFSENIVSCNDTGIRCLGGATGTECAVGLVGPVCLQCDYQNSWYSSDSGKCVFCPEGALDIVGSILYNVLYFAIQIVIIMSSYKENMQIHKLVVQGEKIKIRPASFIRLLSSYSQILTVISQMQDDITQFLGYGQILANPYGQSFFSLSCALLKFGYTAFLAEKIKIVISLFSPIAKGLIILIGLGIYKLYTVIKKKKQDVQTRVKIAVAISVIILLEQPSIVGNLASFFTCEELIPGSGQYYLYRNKAISCDSDQYKYFRYLFIVPGFLIWGVVIPLSIFLILYQHRKDLSKKTELRLSFGSLYNECTDRRYYWGLVIMILKLLVYVANSVLNVNFQTRAMTLAQLFVAYQLILTFSGNPYIDEDLFNHERLAFVAYFVTMFYTVYFVNSDLGWLKYISLVMIGIVNFIFVLKVGFKLLMMYFTQVKAFVEELIKKCTFKNRKPRRMQLFYTVRTTQQSPTTIEMPTDTQAELRRESDPRQGAQIATFFNQALEGGVTPITTGHNEKVDFLMHHRNEGTELSNTANALDRLSDQQIDLHLKSKDQRIEPVIGVWASKDMAGGKEKENDNDEVIEYDHGYYSTISGFAQQNHEPESAGRQVHENNGVVEHDPVNFSFKADHLRRLTNQLSGRKRESESSGMGQNTLRGHDENGY